MKKSIYLTFQLVPPSDGYDMVGVRITFHNQCLYMYDVESVKSMLDIFDSIGLDMYHNDKLMMYVPRVGNGIIFTRVDGFNSKKCDLIEDSENFLFRFFRRLYDASHDSYMAGVLDFLRTFVLSNSQDAFCRARSLSFYPSGESADSGFSCYSYLK